MDDRPNLIDMEAMLREQQRREKLMHEADGMRDAFMQSNRAQRRAAKVRGPLATPFAAQKFQRVNLARRGKKAGLSDEAIEAGRQAQRDIEERTGGILVRKDNGELVIAGSNVPPALAATHALVHEFPNDNDPED